MSTDADPVSTDVPSSSSRPKRVAVVGSGVSGLAASWALNEFSSHEVVLFESADYIGGHTNTVTFSKDGQTCPVDSGFIVANSATYPNLLAFFEHQGIHVNETEMSFSVSRDNGAFEWSGSGLSSVFAQRSNITNPDIYAMMYDIFRFNQYATDILDREAGEADRDLSISQYLEKYNYSQSFTDNYLIVRALIVNRPPWLTVKNGARTYVKSITDKMALGSVRVNTPIREVYRANDKVYVKFHDQEEVFDHIIFACHADTTLQILGSQATPAEREILSSFTFNENTAILHSDLNLMPVRRDAWTSWNFMTQSSPSSQNIDSVCLTYWMNNLQHIHESDFGPVLVTLNPLFRPSEATIQGEYRYAHPEFTPNAVAAQNRLHEIQNVACTSFAGAWTKYGFHEDGFSSGLQVAIQHLDATPPFEFVDATFMRGEKREVSFLDRVARGVFWGTDRAVGVMSRARGSNGRVKRE